MGVPPGSRSLMYCKSKGPSFFISKKKGNKFVHESTYSYIYIYCTNIGNLAVQFLFVPHLLKIRIIFIQSTHTGEVRHLTWLEVIWFDLRVKSRQTDQSQGLFGQQFCSWYYKGVPLTRHFAQSRNPDGYSWHPSSRIPHPVLIITVKRLLKIAVSSASLYSWPKRLLLTSFVFFALLSELFIQGKVQFPCGGVRHLHRGFYSHRSNIWKCCVC